MGDGPDLVPRLGFDCLEGLGDPEDVDGWLLDEPLSEAEMEVVLIYLQGFGGRFLLSSLLY